MIVDGFDFKDFDCIAKTFCKIKSKEECEKCYYQCLGEQADWESMTDEERYTRELMNGEGYLDDFGHFHYHAYYDDE